MGPPDAILFLRISRVGVFQQPQAITLRTLPGQGYECKWDFATVDGLGLRDIEEQKRHNPSCSIRLWLPSPGLSSRSEAEDVLES